MERIEYNVTNFRERFRLPTETLFAIYCSHCKKLLYSSDKINAVTNTVAHYAKSEHEKARRHDVLYIPFQDGYLWQTNMDIVEKVFRMYVLTLEVEKKGTPIPLVSERILNDTINADAELLNFLLKLAELADSIAPPKGHHSFVN